jgi:hypothetical protein
VAVGRGKHMQPANSESLLERRTVSSKCFYCTKGWQAKLHWGGTRFCAQLLGEPSRWRSERAGAVMDQAGAQAPPPPKSG